MNCQKQTHHPSTKVFRLFDELSDNNASEGGLSLAMSVTVNEQISEVILMLGNNGTLLAYQINTCYNTYAHDSAFCHII